MNLFQVFNGTKTFGHRVLFDSVRFSINQGEHVGVIGPNGAGKTTLFKIIVGVEHFDSGEITKSSGLRIGYLEQESEWNLSETAEEYLESNCTTSIWELKKLGLELGLSNQDFEKKLSELSGGFRMRMKLLYLIGLEPDLLMLDEPTNFLDLESILALEKFLQSYKNAFLLISHDRDFLRRTTNSTLEIESEDVTKFPGNIDDYFEQKAEIQKVLMAQAANMETKRAHLQEFIDRFGAKATKAKQAQSRVKQLAKMETIEIKAAPIRARINLPIPLATGKEILSLTDADLGYGDNTILRNVNLRIEKKQKIGIVGFNGAGKSTLLKSLAGRIPLINGELKYGHNVDISYFAQHLTEDLLAEDTVIEALQRKAHKDCMAQEILNIAGSLLFSGNNIYKKMKVLSGGEKTRVALGQILLQKKPVLLMDEPTNHLDFDTVNALAQALADFEGSVIIVSHDRTFIRKVSSQIIEIRNGQVELYPGTYDDYLWSLERGALKERYQHQDQISSLSGAQTKPDNKKINFKDQKKRINAELKELERKILKTEELLFSLNSKLNELNNNLLSATGPQAQALVIESAQISTEIQKTEDILLSHMENLEKSSPAKA
ncbi:MAG: ABC-F family ATP-binding cassette domain-containing protein [Bdellovibrionaceae bacterium]|nr:ABC-F family ATP-binding cassette domain-containing protein [Pseudobdellovibrionaceae bacterium]